MAWTKNAMDENSLGTSLPFPLLADHAQALTRKFDLLDSSQGTSKHALLLLEPSGIIKYKQIGDDKVAFNVDDALATLLSCKAPVFDQRVFEGWPFIYYKFSQIQGPQLNVSGGFVSL